MIDWTKAPRWAKMVIQCDTGYYFTNHNRKDEPVLIKNLNNKGEATTVFNVVESVVVDVKQRKEAVNNPAHYDTFPDMKAIDVIRKTLTDAEFKGYCKGNILKYRLRAGSKGNPEQCIAKANWYGEVLKNA